MDAEIKVEVITDGSEVYLCTDLLPEELGPGFTRVGTLRYSNELIFTDCPSGNGQFILILGMAMPKFVEIVNRVKAERGYSDIATLERLASLPDTRTS